MAKHVLEKTRDRLLYLIAESDHLQKPGARQRCWKFLFKILANFKSAEGQAFLPEEKELARNGIKRI